jgi:hypothetical protein
MKFELTYELNHFQYMMDITKKMNSCGHKYGVKTVTNKWKYIKKIYCKYIDETKQSGSGKKNPPKYFEVYT